MPDRHVICPVADLPEGSRTIVDVEGKSIGIFHVDGEFYGILNVCPHQLAPLCKGNLTGTVTAETVGDPTWERDDRILRCPWHGWEFDITTGESVFNPHEVKARDFDVRTEVLESDERSEYGTALRGEEPPVDTYPVEIEVDDGEEFVVLYA